MPNQPELQLHSYSFHPPLQTAGLGLRDSSWILEFSLHLFVGAASFGTVSLVFSLEVCSFGAGLVSESCSILGEGTWRRLLGESVGWDLLIITSSPTLPPCEGHLCHPTSSHLVQQSRTSGSMGVCDFRRGSLSPATGMPGEHICFCATAKNNTPCCGFTSAGVTLQSSGAGAETLAPSPACAWVGAGCMMLSLSCQPCSSFPPDHFTAVLIP